MSEIKAVYEQLRKLGVAVRISRRFRNPTCTADINAVDFVFIVDTTGSMSNLIGAARQSMIRMVREISRAADIDLHIGIVEYRDHPPQDRMVYRVHKLTGDLATAQRNLARLSANGGGDTPEAVLDGVVAACREMAFRPHSRRIAVLVGDAPPHGCRGHGDTFPKGCPCGETIESASRAAEEAGLTLYALGLTEHARESFTSLALLTGGEFFAPGREDEAIDTISRILQKEFSTLELDRNVYEAFRECPNLTDEELAARVEESRYAVSASLVRLVSRDLITSPES